MIVNAYQTAFHREGEVKIRPIIVPDEEVPEDWSNEEGTAVLLERAFYYGQNDFQPRRNYYSISVGDVVELPDERRFRILGAGWKELEPGEDPKALTGIEANRAGYGF